MTLIQSELQIKATASLRKEIIKELTQPDKSLSFLIKEKDETENNEQVRDRKGEAATK